MVSYKFSDGRILRSFAGGDTDTAAGDIVWRFPTAGLNGRSGVKATKVMLSR